MASYTGGDGHVVPTGQSAPSPHWPGPDWSAVPLACPAANLARGAGASAQHPGESGANPGWPGKGRARAQGTSSLDRYCVRKTEESD